MIGRPRTVAATLGTVWQRVLLDAFLSPRRFRTMMPEFRRVSDMTFHPGIMSLEPYDIPAESAPVQLVSLDGAGGMPPQDLYALSRLVQWVRPKQIFEIGTFNGVSTLHMAVNSDAEVHTLDLPLDLSIGLDGYNPGDRSLVRSRGEIGSAYRGHRAEARIHQLFGDSRVFDYTPYLGSMDVVLVDGCHSYDYVISDSRHAFELVGKEGLVLWHDFGFSAEVTRACRLLARSHPIFHIEGTWLAIHARGERLAGALEHIAANGAQL